MNTVTIEKLNQFDDPRKFDGELLCDDGKNQLWQFSGKFANRYEDGDDFFWSSDEDDLTGWFPNNDRNEWIKNCLD